MNDLIRQKYLFVSKKGQVSLLSWMINVTFHCGPKVGLRVAYDERFSFPKLGAPKPRCRYLARAMSSRAGFSPSPLRILRSYRNQCKLDASAERTVEFHVFSQQP